MFQDAAWNPELGQTEHVTVIFLVQLFCETKFQVMLMYSIYLMPILQCYRV